MNKHLKLFVNHSAYSQAESNLDKPNVAVCLLEGDVHFNPDPPPIIDGHEYVDLGLPSGTLWATMNVGAISETDYGNYYMYGMGSKTYDSSDTSYTGKENPLDLTKDTARVVWGGRWHMPTTTLLYELIENTNYEWVTNYKNSGINGGTFTANDKTIFIPAAGNYYKGELSEVGSEGCCWSSKPSEYSNWALLLNLSEEMNAVTETTGIRGFSIRPVVG